MSSGAGVLKDLIAHVPVDRFEIVNGPSAEKCVELLSLLPAAGRVLCMVTLKTAASETTFRRELDLATIFNVEHGAFHFTAMFSGRVVSGVYVMRTRTGWFSLD